MRCGCTITYWLSPCLCCHFIEHGVQPRAIEKLSAEDDALYLCYMCDAHTWIRSHHDQVGKLPLRNGSQVFLMAKSGSRLERLVASFILDVFHNRG